MGPRLREDDVAKIVSQKTVIPAQAGTHTTQTDTGNVTLTSNPPSFDEASSDSFAPCRSAIARTILNVKPTVQDAKRRITASNTTACSSA
jgi:hypothetical protein